MVKAIGFVFAMALMSAASASAAQFALTSPTLIDGKTVPEAHVYNGFGHHEKNLSPELFWSGAPVGTKSFAVTVFDPDAPRPSGWWHWLVFDIPAEITHLPQGAGNGHGLPEGALEIKTDFGQAGYGGPAPPPGKPHRYIFTLYALKTAKLGLGSNAGIAEVEAAIAKVSIAKASITALYGH